MIDGDVLGDASVDVALPVERRRREGGIVRAEKDAEGTAGEEAHEGNPGQRRHGQSPPNADDISAWWRPRSVRTRGAGP